MKKNVYLLITIFILIFSCSKKGRLQVNTLELVVEPNPVMVGVGKSIDLTCTGKSAKSDNVDINPVWTVSPGIGYISPTRGKKVTFTAGDQTGTGKIRATEGEVYVEVNVLVTSTTTGGGTGGGGGLIYSLFSETYSGIKFDTSNPPDEDGGCIGAWGDANLSSTTVQGEFTEGIMALKCEIGNTGGGWWIQFGSNDQPGYNNDPKRAKDMSAFIGGYLKFDIRTSKNIIIKIEWTGGYKEIYLNNLGNYLDDQWYSISIPLSNFSGIQYDKIEVPVGFHSAWGSTNFTFYIDNVRYEK